MRKDHLQYKDLDELKIDLITNESIHDQVNIHLGHTTYIRCNRLNYK